MGKDKKIINKLSKAISNKIIDKNEILRLSHELSQSDESNTVRFTTDAGIIDKLGKELVARQETAVVELIKNSYDADATRVDLIFSNAGLPGGSLEISDDGIGMTREELINGFMRLSSTNKIKNPMSRLYNRQRAGRKGIGRFATQRLGHQLTIETKSDLSQVGYEVSILWDRFKPGEELILIENNIIKRFNLERGTKLTISDLYEDWTDAEIRRVFRYVSDIMQPYPIAKVSRNRKADPGFVANMFRSDGTSLDSVADEESQILQYALAEVEGGVEKGRKGFWRYKSNRYDLPNKKIKYQKEGKEVIFKHLESINFKAYYFMQPRDEEVYPKNLKRHINSIAKQKGGIRVYRNGFRVPPYGNKGDDWLKLADSSARRVVLIPHGNINWIGIAELTDPDGTLFEEKSSREGLIENRAFEELVEFLRTALINTALAVGSARARKLVASQKDWTDKIDEATSTTGEAIQSITKRIRLIFKEEVKSQGKYSSQEARSINELEKTKLLDKLTKLTNTLIDENAMLRVLASTGITVGEFIHEVNHTIGSIEANIYNLRQESTLSTSGTQHLNNLDANTKRFTSYVSYFDQTIREVVFRKLKPIEVGEVVHSFVDSTQALALQRGIDLSANVKGFDLFSVEMHDSELSSILINLYSNSVKAIRRAQVKGRIEIDVRQKSGFIQILFSDNGDGISDNLPGTIFEPFVTISNLQSTNSVTDDQSGLGLGLKIVKDIVSSYRGQISVIESEDRFVTTFKILIPAKNG